MISIEQFHRLQTTTDLGRLRSIQKGRQITPERQPRHFGTVSLPVIRSPARLNRVGVLRPNGRRKQRMRDIDAGIQQADVRHRSTFARHSRALEQIVRPFRLLFRWQRIEEIGGLLGAAQLSDTIQGQLRTLHLIQGAVDQQHRAFWKFDLSFCHAEIQPLRHLLELLDYHQPVTTHRQPHLPPEGFVGFRGKNFGGVCPQRADTGHPNAVDGIDQLLVSRLTLGRIFFQIGFDLVFEDMQFAVGHVDGGQCLAVFVADIQKFNSEAFRRQRFEGQFDIRKALEFDLQAEVFFHAALLLPCFGLFKFQV